MPMLSLCHIFTCSKPQLYIVKKRDALADEVTMLEIALQIMICPLAALLIFRTRPGKKYHEI